MCRLNSIDGWTTRFRLEGFGLLVGRVKSGFEERIEGGGISRERVHSRLIRFCPQTGRGLRGDSEEEKNPPSFAEEGARF